MYIAIVYILHSSVTTYLTKVLRQCDGHYPACGRCRGYGYACSWPENPKNRSQSLDNAQIHSPTVAILEEQVSSAPENSGGRLCRALQSYEKLVSSIWPSLNNSSRAAVDLTLFNIRRQLPEVLTRAMMLDRNPAAAEGPGSLSPEESGEKCSKRQRYLGEASDVDFFHMVKQALGDKQMPENAIGNDIQSYDQDEFSFESPNGCAGRLHLPTRDIADNYIDIYFCTIHIAYPFIYKPSFMVLYENFWRGDVEVGKSSSWLPLLCKLSLPRVACLLTNPRHHLRYWGLLFFLSSLRKCRVSNPSSVLRTGLFCW
jgi:hypothetical protein